MKTENCSLRPYFAEPGTDYLFLSVVFDNLPSFRERLDIWLDKAYKGISTVTWSDTMKGSK